MAMYRSKKETPVISNRWKLVIIDLVKRVEIRAPVVARDHTGAEITEEALKQQVAALNRACERIGPSGNPLPKMSAFRLEVQQ